MSGNHTRVGKTRRHNCTNFHRMRVSISSNIHERVYKVASSLRSTIACANNLDTLSRQIMNSTECIYSEGILIFFLSVCHRDYEQNIGVEDS